MKYLDDLQAKLNGQVKEWKSVRDGYIDAIETEKQNISTYKAEIEKDMIDGDGATTETAVASINKEYAEKRLHKAEADLKAHCDRPLYTADEYNEACLDVRAVYGAEIRKLKDELKQKVREAFDVIDKINDVRSEGDSCARSIKSAVEQTGKDPKVIYKDCTFGYGRVVNGILYQTQIEDSLKDAQKQLERTI